MAQQAEDRHGAAPLIVAVGAGAPLVEELERLAQAFGARLATAAAPAATDNAAASAATNNAAAAPAATDNAAAAPAAAPAREDAILRGRLRELTAEREALLGEIADLRAAIATTQAHAGAMNAQTIILDETIAHPAFYGPERTARGRPFRWMGRQDEAVFATRIAPGFALKVSVTVELSVSQEALASLQIGLDGDYRTPQQSERLAGGAVRKTLYVEAREGVDAAERAKVGLRMTKGARRIAGDTRRLSIAVSEILIETLFDEVAALGMVPREVVLGEALAGPAFEAVPAHEPHERPGAALVPGRAGRVTFHLSPGAPVVVEAAVRDEGQEMPPLRLGLGERLSHSAPVRVGEHIVCSAPLTVPGEPGAPPEAVPVTLFLEPGAARAILSFVAVRPSHEEEEATAGGAFLAQILMDDTLPARWPDAAQALYGQEVRKDGLAFRWLGRSDSVSLSPKAPLGALLRVRVFMAFAIKPQFAERVSITLDGEDPLERRTERQADGTFLAEALFAARAPGTSGDAPARITVSSPDRAAMTAHGDPRTLSVALHRVDIEDVPAD